MWVELLIETQYFEVRESFAKLLTTAISVTAKNEESYLDEVRFTPFSHEFVYCSMTMHYY
jgi:hypothetical protein